MKHEDVELMAHLAASSPLSLEEFCTVAKRALGLPAFEYDAENETEWGVSVNEGIEYNISRPYKEGTLQRWDSASPLGCNFGVILIFPKTDAAPTHEKLAVVERVGQALATALSTALVHHRTWLGVGNSRSKNVVYAPQPSDA
jgi:hypothetical protein